MGIFDKIKNVLGEVAQPTVGKVAPVTEGKKKTQVKQPKVAVGKPSAPPAPVKKPRAKKKPVEVVSIAKAAANKAGEPYVEVLSISIDPNDPGAGSFELDWNDIFVARLIKSGYQGKTDQDIVDNWFRAVCRNVVMEHYEQEQADPEIRGATTKRRDLGNGRTEVS